MTQTQTPEEMLDHALTLISDLKREFKLKSNNRDKIPFFYCGVADSNIIEGIMLLVIKYFGNPYKASGEISFWMNFFDSFVKDVGGVRREQTLFRLDCGEGIQLFCAFWPWGSDPIKTSIRIGMLHDDSPEQMKRVEPFKNRFL
jgi:hypothetical protein